LKYQTSKENVTKIELPEIEKEEFLSCNVEDSFQKDFADLNSEQTNRPYKNDGDQTNNKSKSTDKIYEVQKIILMLRIFNLKLHVQKFRDNKVETKDSVIFFFSFYCYFFFKYYFLIQQNLYILIIYYIL